MCDKEGIASNEAKTTSEQTDLIIPGNTTCRACLAQDEEMHPLFFDRIWGSPNPRTDLLEMFTSCTALDVTLNDPYPKQICSNCLSKLYEAYSFWKKCRDSIELMNNMDVEMDYVEVKDDFDVLHSKFETTLTEKESVEQINDKDEIVFNTSCNKEDHLLNLFSSTNHFSGLEETIESAHTNSEVVSSEKEDLCAEQKRSEICEFLNYSPDLFGSDDSCGLEKSTQQEFGHNSPSEDTNEKSMNQKESSTATEIKPTNRIRGKVCCRKCLIYFDNKTAYNKHWGKYHKDSKDELNKVRTCEKCQIAFTSKLEYKRHWERTHKIYKKRDRTNEKKYVKKPRSKYCCRACNLVYTSELEYRRHRRAKHPNTTGTYTCKKCNISFQGEAAYDKHRKIHLQYLCSECGHIARSKTNFRNHIQKHSNSKPFECTSCDKKYKTLFSLNIHKRTHVDAEQYPCPSCDKKFSTWNARYFHVQEHHTVHDKHVCEICSIGFSTAYKLKLHIRRHTGERPYTCEKCQATFSMRQLLTMHLRRHSDIRKYPCLVCEKRFKVPKDLRQHMVTHTGIRKHKCEICEKAFTQAHVLRNHMKIHKSQSVTTTENIEEKIL